MNQVKFHSWLESNGAQIMPATNPYEVARFIAHGGTCIVYANSKGKISANGFALKAVEAFERNQKLDMGFAKTARTVNTKYKAALLKRDGRECFYCGLDMPDEDVTIEHLIALDKGGNNRLENMALAHYECNQKAGNMHLTAKIKLRDRLRHDAQPKPLTE
jgi:hypothetical protein